MFGFFSRQIQKYIRRCANTTNSKADVPVNVSAPSLHFRGAMFRIAVIYVLAVAVACATVVSVPTAYAQPNTKMKWNEGSDVPGKVAAQHDPEIDTKLVALSLSFFECNATVSLRNPAGRSPSVVAAPAVLRQPILHALGVRLQV